jgi:uncharacterized protein (TIGR02246 family)
LFTKTLISALAIILFAFGCQPQETADVEAEKRAVGAVLDNYVKSIVEEDMDLYGQLVAHDSEMVNFGGFGDPIIGWDALEPVMTGQNEMLSGTSIDVSDVNIHICPDGSTAWATSLWLLKAMAGDNEMNLPIRCTWVLEKREGGWKIVHFHKSMAAG